MEKLWNSNYTKVWIANFMLFFSFMLLMPLFPLYLSETYGADKQTIGIVLSGYTITALLIRPFSGFIVDSFPRKMVLLICYSIFALFFAGYLAAGSLVLFAVVRTLHGAPFGATTVANSTVAIDVLAPSRRTEGIAYYGLANNIATAIGPTVAIYILNFTGSFTLLFVLALLFAVTGFIIDTTVDIPKRETQKGLPAISLDRFFLLSAWSESILMVCFGLSWGVLSTYVAIYAKEELNIIGGTGLFFFLLALGLILSRLAGTRILRKGLIRLNAGIGMVVSMIGYLMFATVHAEWAYYTSALIIGLGNGRMFPSVQNMFINLAPNNRRGTANSTLLVSWDVGVGLGVLSGGALAQAFNYHASFWCAWAVTFAGVVWFFAYVWRSYGRKHVQ